MTPTNFPTPLPLLSHLAPPPAAEKQSQQLLAAYAEPGRHYHTLTHVSCMLAGLETHGTHLTESERLAVQLAVWFHDVVNDARATEVGGNERESVGWWRGFAGLMVGAFVAFLTSCCAIQVPQCV